MQEVKRVLIPQAHGGALAFPGPGRPKGKTRAKIAREILEMCAEQALPVEIYKDLKKRYPNIDEKMTLEGVMTVVQAMKAILKEDTNAYTALINNAYKPLERGSNSGNTYVFTTNMNNTPYVPHNDTIDVEITSQEVD